MASSHLTFQVKCCLQKSSFSYNFDHLKTLSSSFKPFLGELHQLSMRSYVSKTIKDASVKLLDKFVDLNCISSTYLQSNFAPADELGKAVLITSIEGEIPDDFPQGVYIRNGQYFQSMFPTFPCRHVETETFLLEKRRNKPSFLPAVEGDSPAILSASLLNLLRFGKKYKHISNTNVFEHSGKFYSIAENRMSQKINIFTLETLGNWDVDTTWNRPFTSHPKRAPGTGELVITVVRPTKPFVEVGIISADGNQLIHKVDLKLNRCTLMLDMGVTQRYNVILDFPLSIDINKIILGGPEKLTRTKLSMDFPVINAGYTGIENKYGYTQIADSTASSASGMPKFGGLAKLYLEEPDMEGLKKVEYQKFAENVFCTGAAFVSKGGNLEEEEDDGWIITYVHNEDTNTSQVYIIDTKKFTSEPVAKITLPCRVPYGFHGAFMPVPLKTSEAS
ncbi:hypothetical protein JRO89_XS02G0051400 [Xanthoceras sorbifolium]|uniref:Uncharacterized protein n=1 Tax=Xanthoceras sorbifolium TaxID=99658 RepID=A0ABQ8IEN6_9ROSI|nr:hypothetical protein JRO89_XS02G0051400 [Xanthoceras sorbifolium]